MNDCIDLVGNYVDKQVGVNLKLAYYTILQMTIIENPLE